VHWDVVVMGVLKEETYVAKLGSNRKNDSSFWILVCFKPWIGGEIQIREVKGFGPHTAL